MTTSRQQTANRENARASTGPRTAAGQARAKRNARRHGLAARNRLSGSLANEVKALAHQIAGSNPSSAVLTAAGRIAEAQIDLVQVRAARQQLIAPSLSDEETFVWSERWIVMSDERCPAASGQARIWTQSESSKPLASTITR